jgi:hypothetical protein
MSSEQNKAVIRRFIEEVNNKGEKTGVEQYLTRSTWITALHLPCPEDRKVGE